MNKKLLIALAVVMVSCLAVFQSAVVDADEPESAENKVRLEFGNGQTDWAEGTGETVGKVLQSACTSTGFTFSDDGGNISVNGKTTYTIGTTENKWNYYEYGTSWTKTAYSGSAAYSSGKYIAIGFYPADIVPTVTPAHMNAWTMIRADAANTGSVINYQPSTEAAAIDFEYYDNDTLPSCYSTVLYADGYFIVHSADYAGASKKCHMLCFDEEGNKVWGTDYGLMGYALSTGVIYNGNAYFSAASGVIRCVPITGTDAGTVTHTYTIDTKIPSTASTVMVGAGTMVYDAGHLFVASSGGQVACLTPDLDEVWKTDIGAAVYPSVPITVVDDRIYIGACDGKIYILDESDGSKLASLALYTSSNPSKPGGRVGTPTVIGSTIYVSYSDGLGMSSNYWGSAVLKYNSTTNALTYIKDLKDLAIQNNYLTPDYSGKFVYALGDDTLYKIYSNGNYDTVGSVTEIHGGLTLVNNAHLYGTDYDSKGKLSVFDTDGKLVASFKKSANTEQYSMGCTLVAGPYTVASTDAGAMFIKGSLVDSPVPPGPVPPGPDPPEPTHKDADVSFVIADGSGFYTTVTGNGMMVSNALKAAIDGYNYSKTVVYSGGSEKPTGIATMFGLSFNQIDETHYAMWNICVWNSGSSEWQLSSELIDKLYADECQGILVLYSVTDGTTVTVPGNTPSPAEMKPLVKSDEGTRFLIQSPLGAYLVINGKDRNLSEAFKDALVANSIPFTESNESYTFFGMNETSDLKWNKCSADSEKWSSFTGSMASVSSDGTPLFGMCFGAASSLPTMAPGDLFNGGYPSTPASDDLMWLIPVIIVAIIAVAVIGYLIYIKKTQEMPVFAYIRQKIKLETTDSKVRRNKLKLLIVCTIGLTVTFIMFLCSLAIGPTATLSLPDALSALVSAVNKHGQDLTFQEIIVYESRLPRAIATLAVGIGLSVAGCVYQAIIRNPLVDPYIMGVSSGAGTFAVAAISANFTFFGLLSSSNFTIPILAVMGGLIAFGLTLLIAEKAGGSSTNYVLAGVIIGLVFGAVQTMLLVTSDNSKLASAMSWLFGSFANVSWNTVWIIFFPAIFLSLVPMFWAKELNLVLLGEDQAKQMGLNVRKFNRWMLILASVLTSVCVAFVGIIGFVGMVIPHLARMILGGDHRLVLPSSIMMGGALMLFADLMAKMLMIPTELPVGAITTIIGVPVFAYLLIKKGRMYSG
ncbi:MAG: iron chelate uptake ABC transporter family permease subunit [archaeon]|nr:iron chelate uptake ABC transporter family permease subunit [archaeon]